MSALCLKAVYIASQKNEAVPNRRARAAAHLYRSTLMMLIRPALFPMMMILIVGFGFNSSTLCFAQSDRQPQWVCSTTTRVKPERVREFERCLRDLRGLYKHAGAPWFVTFQTFAGDTTEYTTVTPVMKFGDLDNPSLVTRMLGEADEKRLSRKFARCYTSQTREYATPQVDLDIGTGKAPLETYWVETSISVVPGKMADYLNWLKDDYRPALEKAGVARFQVSRPIFGTAAGEIITMRMLRNLAEIDAGAVLSRGLSDREAREIAAKSVPLVSSSNTRIVRMRADLSYSEGTVTSSR